MGNMTMALVFVMLLNVFMWLSQVAALDINPSGPQYYHCEGSVMEGFGSDCDNVSRSVVNTDVVSQLPQSQNIVVSSGNPFTDVFNNILSWMKGVPGVNYAVSIVSAPSSILKSMGMPNELSFGLGVLWYGITVFLLVSFLWGRES